MSRSETSTLEGLPEAEVAPSPSMAPVPPPRPTGRLRDAATSVGLGLAGAAGLILLWQVVTLSRPTLGPVPSLRELGVLLSHPLHDTGPNIGDKGIFVLIRLSLVRLFTGFAVAAAVGIPLGFAVGAIRSFRRATNPIVQVLRPVSPLAWFPIAVALTQKTPLGAVFTIAITTLWPTLINTAFGVGAVPEDHRNVARVFRFSRFKYVLRVLLPCSLGSIITGLRLSLGIGWMVLVAVEMLAALPGVGGFVWDSYNNLNYPSMTAAILFIGIIGLSLDIVLSRLARRFDYAAAGR